MEKIDRLDKKILGILSKNARIPFKDVAAECGVSRAAIHQRVQHLVEDGVITKTLEREKLWMAQTPQAFDTRLIISCYKRAADLKLNATDDAQVVELTCDMPIKCVLGSYDNIKITTKEDIGSH